MIQVPAMTAFKFPAALRSNVYRERPSHEQRAYVTRMERERLFIERELAALALARLSPRGNRARRERFASLIRMEPEELQAYLRRVRGLD